MKALAIHPDSKLLNDIRIAAPCDADWADMVGDERTRHCGQCSKNVYNLSSMTAQQAAELVREREGRVCVRLYRRKDGTVLTADCPVGLAERAWRRAKRSTLAAAALTVALFTGLFAFFFARPTCSLPTYDPGPEMVMGAMAPPQIEMGEPMPEEFMGEMEMGDVALPSDAH
jgi:hypothetical protein